MARERRDLIPFRKSERLHDVRNTLGGGGGGGGGGRGTIVKWKYVKLGAAYYGMCSARPSDTKLI